MNGLIPLTLSSWPGEMGEPADDRVAGSAFARNLPRHLQIEIITRCNLSCAMCPRTVALKRAATEEKREAWQRELPYERFAQIIEQLPDLKTLSLHGIGEPLMHRRLFDMVETAAARGAQARFTTNATLLGREKREALIESGLRRVIISIDGATRKTYEAARAGARFEQVIENVRQLAVRRSHLKRAFPLIEIAMVVSRSSWFEAPQIIDLAVSLGADGVILSQMQPPVPEIWPKWSATRRPGTA